MTIAIPGAKPDIRQIIADSALFNALDAGQITQIASGSALSVVQPNTTVVDHGDVAGGVFWIASGQVKIAVNTKGGQEKIIDILGPQNWFGLSEMMLDRPHLAAVTTTERSTLLHTGRDTLLRVAQDNFSFSREIMRSIGGQAYGLVRDIESYAQTPKRRLAEYLLRQSRRETNEVRLVANKGLIASRLSMTQETLSRLFRDFTVNGLISVAGRQIKILDYERMSFEMG